MDIFNKKTKEAEKQTGGIKKINDAFKLLSPSTLAAAAGVGAIVTAVKSLVGFGSQIINVASQFEQVETSLKTVLGDADRATMMFEDLRKFSFKTTFGVDELAGASSQLLNVGVSTSALQKNLKMLGDLAQGDKTKFQELTSIFAKVQSLGKATSEQLQQIALRGIPITQTLKDMGVTGTASAEQLSAAFEKLTGEGGKFQNAMQNINETIEGKKGFISDTWKEILVNIGEITGLTKAWKGVLDTVADKLNDINNFLIRQKKLNNGEDLSWNEEIDILEGKIKKLQKQKEQFELLNLGDSSDYTQEKIKWYDEQIGVYEKELDMLKGSAALLDEAVEKDRAKIAAYEEQFNKLDKTKTNIQEMYYGTDTGKREKEIKELEELKKLRDLTRTVRSYSPYGGGMIEKTEGLDPESLRMLNVVIAETEAKLYGTKETVKDLGKTWQQVFKDITGVTVKAKEAGAEVAKRYIEGMHSDDISEQLNEILGITPDRLTQLKSDAEEIRNVIESLMKSETRVGDEFKWDDGSIQALINKYKELLKLIEEEENKSKVEIKKEDPFEKELKTIKEMLAYETDIYDTTVLRRIVEKEITEEQYKQLDAEQKKLDRLLKYRQLAQDKRSSDVSTALGAYKEESVMHLQDMNPDGFVNFVTAVNDFCSGVGTFEKVSEELQRATQTAGLGEFTKATVANDAWGMVQGSEVGTFIQTFASTGNILAGVIATVSEAFFNLLGGMEGVQMILNPISEILKAFMPIIKTLLVPLMLLLKLLGSLANGIMKVLNIITFGLFSAGEKLYDSLVGLEESSSSLSVQQSTEVERLRQLNAQYAALKLAIKDQEEYYLKKRRELNADFINQQISAGLSVHDMILTPQGNFSTDPNDYIIATKNPQGLAGGTQVNVIVNNTAADTASVGVQQRQNADGFTELIINVSKAVARDYAQGTNGWDGAILARAQKGSGRSLS